MYFRIGTNIRKCFVYSLNAEPQTCLVWQDELHIAVHLIASNLMLLFWTWRSVKLKLY